MKYALISPTEHVGGGVRIAQVVLEKFDVAQPLYWIEVGDAVTENEWYLDEASGTPLLTPVDVLVFHSVAHTGAVTL